MVETKFLKSPLKLLQQDCEFHRQRAIAAQDEVERLHDYVAKLETDKREGLKAKETDNIRLRDTIYSMEVLNRSLTRQNEILRSRIPGPSTFSKRDVGSQCLPVALNDHGTEILSTSVGTGFSIGLVETATQTQSMLWVSVEELPCDNHKPIRISDQLPQSSTYSKPLLVRRSLPMRDNVYPDSPPSDSLPDISVDHLPLPGPMYSPAVTVVRNLGSPVLTRYSPSVYPSDTSNVHSRPSRKSGRRSSMGASNRKRWIP